MVSLYAGSVLTQRMSSGRPDGLKARGTTLQQHPVGVQKGLVLDQVATSPALCTKAFSIWHKCATF